MKGREHVPEGIDAIQELCYSVECDKRVEVALLMSRYPDMCGIEEGYRKESAPK